MEHGGHSLTFVQEKGQGIPMGFPVVDHHRQMHLPCQIHLLAQPFKLHLPGLIFFPVVIQTDLADGYHLGVGGPCSQLVQITVVLDSRQILGWMPTAA